MTSADTPLREDAFVKSDEEKMANIEKLFGGIMEELGLDLTDDSLKGTPYRVAKMYVKELFEGLNPENKPSLSVFDNKYQYNKMLVEKDITFTSA
ncbi:MAG: GTP cyclohydrolase I, partial [Bacteroidota bacterium]